MKLKKLQEIDILIDNPTSWIWEHIKLLKKVLDEFAYNLRIFENLADIDSGDIMFILSCDKILTQDNLKKHKNNIVIHGSDLPKGAGWSPWSWEVENGADFITLTLFEAGPIVDAGSWYLKYRVNLDGNELIDDIRKKIVTKEVEMISRYLSEYPMKSKQQLGEKTFYQKLSEKNQELYINISIKEQLDKLRVCDNERYPAHFFLMD